jgi:hypothetical protein
MTLTESKKKGLAPARVRKRSLCPTYRQRAFPINSSAGLYKIVIKPTEAYNNLYIACSALGEDGKADILSMESFTYNGSAISISDGQQVLQS